MTGELVKDILDAVPSVWDHAVAIRAAWINRNGFLYAYQVEVSLNLDLLSAVKRDSLTGVSAGSPAFAALVNSLETGTGLALLAGHDRRNYRRLVKLLKKHYAGGGSYRLKRCQAPNFAPVPSGGYSGTFECDDSFMMGACTRAGKMQRRFTSGP
jgi:hypothetical protein